MVSYREGTFYGPSVPSIEVKLEKAIASGSWNDLWPHSLADHVHNTTLSALEGALVIAENIVDGRGGVRQPRGMPGARNILANLDRLLSATTGKEAVRNIIYDSAESCVAAFVGERAKADIYDPNRAPVFIRAITHLFDYAETKAVKNLLLEGVERGFVGHDPNLTAPILQEIKEPMPSRANSPSLAPYTSIKPTQ